MSPGFHSAYIVRGVGRADSFALQHAHALDVWENEGGSVGSIEQVYGGQGDRRSGYEPLTAEGSEQ